MKLLCRLQGLSPSWKNGISFVSRDPFFGSTSAFVCEPARTARHECHQELGNNSCCGRDSTSTTQSRPSQELFFVQKIVNARFGFHIALSRAQWRFRSWSIHSCRPRILFRDSSTAGRISSCRFPGFVCDRLRIAPGATIGNQAVRLDGAPGIQIVLVDRRGVL
jgi:hypothetical protein